MESKPVNINVIVRCRPLTKAELARPNQQIRLHDQGLIEVQPRQANQYPRVYQFDKVCKPETSQQEFYTQTMPSLLEDFVKGYNCSTFAYGQTGSGKSHTMFGPDSQFESGNGQGDLLGVVPRAVFELFTLLNRRKIDFQMKVSHVEVYNEDIYDLLQENQEFREPLKIYEERNSVANAAQATRNKVLIQGLTEITVKTPQEIIALINKSNQNRRVAETKMNEHSSRSHSIFQIQLVQKTSEINTQTNQELEFIKISKLSLVDLAGSESISKSGVDAQSLRQQEASKINKSLLTLGRVINQLVENSAGHIPYRESKLTRLLQDSLGGKTKTCIIACISISDFNADETINTLEYMTRAKKIKNMPELTQRVNSKTILKEYSTELKRLQELLEIQKSEQGGVFIAMEEYQLYEEFVKNRNERIAELETQIQQLIKDSESVREVLSVTEQKYKVVKQELGNAVQQYAVKVQDLQTFEQKLDQGKQREEVNQQGLQNLKQKIRIALDQLFGLQNQQFLQKDFQQQLVSLQIQLQELQKQLASNQTSQVSQLTQDLTNLKQGVLSALQALDPKSMALQTACDETIAKLETAELRERAASLAGQMRQFVETVLQARLEDLQKYVQEQFGLIVNAINDFQNQYTSDQLEAKDYIGRTFDLVGQVHQVQRMAADLQIQRVQQLQEGYDELSRRNNLEVLQAMEQLLQKKQMEQNLYLQQQVKSIQEEQVKASAGINGLVQQLNTERAEYSAKQTQQLQTVNAEIEQTRLHIQATQSSFRQLAGQLRETQQHLANTLLPQQMEAQVYGPVNQIILEAEEQLAAQKKEMENLRIQLQSSAGDVAEKQAGLAIQNCRTLADKNGAAFKKCLPFKGVQFESLTRIEAECSGVLRQLELQLQNTMAELYQFSLSKQLLDQTLRTPRVPQTPELKAVEFPGGVQTQQIFGVKTPVVQ